MTYGLRTSQERIPEMRDKYPNFASLARSEPKGAHSILLRTKGSSVAVVAPHGGGIEPGTSEMTLALAAGDLTYYLFEGAKSSRNRDLHITSTHFDEPQCLSLVSTADRVVTVHGENSDHEVVYLGGTDRAALAALRGALSGLGYTVREHSNQALQGLQPMNLCNRGRSGVGVQMEVSRGLRRTFFASLTRAGRSQRSPQLALFAEAVRLALLRDVT